MLARSQLSKVNTKGSCLSFDIPAMCKINKTRSGQAIGGAGHGAAGGTHGTGGGGGSGDAGSGGGGHGGVNGVGTPRGATSAAWYGKPMGSGGSNRVAAFGTKTLNAPAQTPPRILAPVKSSIVSRLMCQNFNCSVDGFRLAHSPPILMHLRAMMGVPLTAAVSPQPPSFCTMAPKGR